MHYQYNGLGITKSMALPMHKFPGGVPVSFISRNMYCTVSYQRPSNDNNPRIADARKW